MLTRICLFLAACLMAAIPPTVAGAGTGTGSAVSSEEALQASVLPGWRRADGTHVAAIVFRLAPGWKTYWRAPGEAGIAPQFSWRGSANLARAVAIWPRPHAYLTNGYQSIGYKGELILPIELTPKRPGAPIRLRATVDMGVCDDVCLAATVRLKANLVVGGAPDARILWALENQPTSAAEAGVRDVSCSITPITDGLRVTARIGVAHLGGPEETVVFELPDPDIWVGKARISREGDTLTAVSDMISYAPGGVMFDRSQMRLTLLGEARAIDVQGCPAG